MNYLGHLFLAEPTEDGRLGSLLGDFVKGPLDRRYGEPVMRAIALHRRIDSFTDAHPAVLVSKSRVTPARRRYAGIMVDVFYDHFLAKHWNEFHEQPLREFAAHVYEMLERRYDELPARLQQMAPSMIRWDWLGSYAELASIYAALNRMGNRLKRENRLFNSADELLENYPGLEADFRAFLPDAAAFTRERRATP